MLATRDDRGRNVRPFRPGFLLLLRFNVMGKKSGTLPHAVCQRGLKMCGCDPRVWVVLVAVIATFMGSVVLGLPLISPYLMPMSGILPVLFGALTGAVSVVPIFFTLSLAPRLAWARWVDEVVGSGYCASCGQPLDGIPEADDCRRVCPECGSAWSPRPLARHVPGSGGGTTPRTPESTPCPPLPPSAKQTGPPFRAGRC